jgi:nitroimidazol reductase NimA-like FMN-containing flavoprotein (pyridoxamine 5'-phosphate oxidase superfamily)
MHIRDKAIKEITLQNELLEVINKCKVCHVGFVDGDKPYVLAFNFGFDGKSVYLHCAKEGYKIDVLNKNNQVCIEFDTDHDLFARHEEVACSWRMRYRSVIVWGKAEFVSDYNEKVDGLKIFMKNYSDLNFEFSIPSVNNILIIKIPIDKMTGRKFEYL